jgi:hypothetical protein
MKIHHLSAEKALEKHVGFQVLSAAAEGILKCGKIVNIQCHHRIGAHRSDSAAT